jgi:hypothetical protein
MGRIRGRALFHVSESMSFVSRTGRFFQTKKHAHAQAAASLRQQDTREGVSRFETHCTGLIAL